MELIRTAFDMRVTLFDSAEAYGPSRTRSRSVANGI
jgi:hypothetical protein